MELNARANVMVGKIIYPALAFVFAFANELVTFFYTSTYIEAAAVIRIYVVGLAVLVVELATMTLILRQGQFILGLNFLGLFASIAVSWTAAQHIGLPGAAIGSVSVAVVDRIVTLLRIAGLTGVPIRRLQHWRLLFAQLGLALAAAAFAWMTTLFALDIDTPVLRLLIGGGLVASLYTGLHYVFVDGILDRSHARQRPQ